MTHVFRNQRGSDLLEMTLTGFWTMDDAVAFDHELRLHVDAIRARHGHLRSLVLATDDKVQSTATLAHVGNVNSVLIRGPQDRVAVVVANSLVRMQAARLAASAQAKIFFSADEAMAWLDDQAGTATASSDTLAD